MTIDPWAYPQELRAIARKLDEMATILEGQIAHARRLPEVPETLELHPKRAAGKEAKP